MFPALLTKVLQQVDTVRRSIETTDEARNLLSSAPNLAELATLRGKAPSSTDWRIYDHCAALTRLYAIYENFVQEIVGDLLSILPTLFKYADLPNSFHEEHRFGVAHVLQQVGKTAPRYRSLSTEDIVKDYYEAVSGVAANYRILPLVMLRSEQNLRMNILELIFNRIGISGLSEWLARHRLTEDFIHGIRGNQNTIEAELTSFIQYRNEAAHGEVVNVLGREALLEYCAFIDALCQALYEAVNHWVLGWRLAIGTAVDIGEVTETYSNNISVAIVHDVTVDIGANFFFVGERYAYRAMVENIQILDIDQQHVVVGENQELGLKTNVPLKLGARVIALK